MERLSEFELEVLERLPVEPNGLSLAELQARLTGMRSRLTEASLLAAEAESAK